MPSLDRIIYANEETGYTVARVATGQGRNLLSEGAWRFARCVGG
jgi:hypothetical protein